MVQFFRGSPDPRNELIGQLGSALGMGLGSALTYYQANKSLDDVLNDKSNADLPASEKMGKLESALRPYGETGQKLLMNRMAVEQQAFQEKQQKEMQREAKEKESRLFEQQKQLQEMRNQARAAPGGVSAQPVPPEVSQKIPTILNQNKEANADDLAQAFDQAGIPRTFSNSYIENRRRQDEAKAKGYGEEIKSSRKEELQFHTESADYDQELMKNAKIAKNQEHTLTSIEKALESGNIKPSSWANIFKGFGKAGDKISDAFLSKDEATLMASIPSLLEGWKQVFGVRLSDADLKLLQDKLPSIGKDVEANRAILKVMRKYSKLTTLRGEIAEKIKEDNKGLRPLGYASKVEKRFDDLTKPVRIVNPKSGREIEIPAFEVSAALKSGARLADE